MKNCPHCGKEIEEDAVVCEHCGSQLEKKEEESPVTEEPLAAEELAPADEPATVEEIPDVEEPATEKAPPIEEPAIEGAPVAEEAPVAESKKPRTRKGMGIVGALIAIVGLVLIALNQLDFGIGAAAIGLIILVYGMIKKG